MSRFLELWNIIARGAYPEDHTAPNNPDTSPKVLKPSSKPFSLKQANKWNIFRHLSKPPNTFCEHRTQWAGKSKLYEHDSYI